MRQLIREARIVDGTGRPGVHGDVLIEGDRVRAILPPGSREAADVVVEARGRVLAPGFVDIMSHSIVSLLHDGRSLSKVTQGVTSEIMGEGWTPAPVGGLVEEPFAETYGLDVPPEWRERARGWTRFSDWLDAVVARGTSVNVGSFLGGGTLRRFVKGSRTGECTPRELDEMRAVAAGAMQDGAFGVAYALIYPPDHYASTAELIEVARVVASYGGVFASHIRDESAGLLDALEETFAVARNAGVSAHVYHLKAAGRANWPLMRRALERIEHVRTTGLDVTADVYPYTVAGTGLAAALPPWAAEGAGWRRRLTEPAGRAALRAALVAPTPGWEVLITDANTPDVFPVGLQRPEHRSSVGRSLDEIARARGQHWADAALDLLHAEGQSIFTFYREMSEDNLELQLRRPWVMVASDAEGVAPNETFTNLHPRAFGTFPRVLARYVRERSVLSLEEAVRKMTSLPAGRLGLEGRGLVKVGAYADLVLFDPEAVQDHADFTHPQRLSSGVSDVWVNGERVLENGEHTGRFPGRALRGRGGRQA